MKNIIVHRSFSPVGTPSNETYDFGKSGFIPTLSVKLTTACEAMTLESGVQWNDAYAAATAANRTLVGGASLGGSVGAAGGWLLGGGHSALSPSYGLGTSHFL